MAKTPRYECLRNQFIKELERLQRDAGEDDNDEYVNIDAICLLDPNVYDKDAVSAAFSAACRAFTDEWLFEPQAVLPEFLDDLISICQNNIIYAASLWVQRKYGRDAARELADVLNDGDQVMALYRASSELED